MPSRSPEPLHGVPPVLQTPFTGDGEIEVETLHRGIDRAFEVGAAIDAIEKYLLKKRGLFVGTAQKQPVGWQPDPETQVEVDCLFGRLLREISRI